MEEDKILKKIKELDIDWLKNNHERLYYFGLGFIQLKINHKYRLHFYTDKLKSNTDSIHNHRYDFKSIILKGTLNNKLYSMAKGSTHYMINESCNEKKSINVDKIECSVKLIKDITYDKGNSYFMEYNKFHKVNSNYAITLLERSDYRQEEAQVIYRNDEEVNCPFSLKVDSEKLWNIMEEMIND